EPQDQCRLGEDGEPDRDRQRPPLRRPFGNQPASEPPARHPGGQGEGQGGEEREEERGDHQARIIAARRSSLPKLASPRPDSTYEGSATSRGGLPYLVVER